MINGLSRFWDKPANVPENRTFEEEALYQLGAANSSVSQSGSICQLIGLLLVAASPFALAGGLFGLPIAASLIEGGASSAALGSIAHSNKRAFRLLYVQTWLKVNNY